MKLLSLHYTNIGPFQNQTVIVRPTSGSFLIKAPIGSGKSILFFDGPLFGLYKKGTRPLLNRNAQKGELVVEFQVDGVSYCIQRILTKTKNGESVKSKLFQKIISGQEKLTQDELITFGPVSQRELPSGYESVELKNEIDLQKLVDDLIPKREVLLATYFLLQESKNIFELQAQERMTILKNVFDLIGIDETKEVIAENKREVTAIIKARSDQTQYDDKFSLGLETLKKSWNKVVDILQYYMIDDPRFIDWKSFFFDQTVLQGKILIEHFQLPEVIMLEPIWKKLQDEQEDYVTQKARVDFISSQIQEKRNATTVLKQEINTTEVLIQQIKENDKDDISSQYEQSKIELEQLQEQLNKLWNENKSNHYKQIFLNVSGGLIQELQEFSDDYSLVMVARRIDKLIALGKDYKTNLMHLKEKKDTLDKQVIQLREQIKIQKTELNRFQTYSEEQLARFSQAERQGPCAELYASMKFDHNKQIELLNNHYKDLHKQIEQGEHNLQELINGDEQRRCEDGVKELSELMKHLDRKKIQEIYSQYTLQEQKIQFTRKECDILQKKYESQQHQREQLIIIQTKLDTLQQSLKTQESELTLLKMEQEKISQHFSTMKTNIQIQSEKTALEYFVQVVEKLQILLSEYKDNLLKIKQLKERERMLSDLSVIFSKELLLLVIQSNLPKIQDLMNAYLSQVVDYQIRMEIDKKSATSDTLELLVTISDQYGERQVESLSGGQKVILKLVWMIAISFIKNAPMLYLDETINNLDADTVAKVAEMITSFVKTKGSDFQFYVVSHSDQIQEMSIWDKIIEINGQFSNNENVEEIKQFL